MKNDKMAEKINWSLKTSPLTPLHLERGIFELTPFHLERGIF
jgi:hypothetical protein